MAKFIARLENKMKRMVFGDVDFICDGVMDQIEINAAIEYVFTTGKSVNIKTTRGIWRISKVLGIIRASKIM